MAIAYTVVEKICAQDDKSYSYISPVCIKQHLSLCQRCRVLKEDCSWCIFSSRDFWPGNSCWPTGKKEARKKREKGGKKVENWKRNEEKLENFFFFFCLSLFKTTKICFGSTKMEIYYREKAFHAGKKKKKKKKKSGKSSLFTKRISTQRVESKDSKFLLHRYTVICPGYKIPGYFSELSSGKYTAQFKNFMPARMHWYMFGFQWHFGVIFPSQDTIWSIFFCSQCITLLK